MNNNAYSIKELANKSALYHERMNMTRAVEAKVMLELDLNPTVEAKELVPPAFSDLTYNEQETREICVLIFVVSSLFYSVPKLQTVTSRVNQFILGGFHWPLYPLLLPGLHLFPNHPLHSDQSRHQWNGGDHQFHLQWKHTFRGGAIYEIRGRSGINH